MKEFAQKPFLFSMAAITVMILLPWLLMPVIQILFGHAFHGMESLLYGLFYLVDTLIILLLALVCGKTMDKGFRLGISWNQLGKSVLLCLPMLLEAVYSVWFYILADCPRIDQEAAFLAAGNALQSGITEEVVFRCLILGNLADQWRGQRKGRQKALLAAALLFSFSHLVNAASGQGLLITAVQMMYAFSVGCLTGMAYLRTRNLLGPILVHTVHNCVTMMLAIGLEGTVDLPLGATVTVVCVKLLTYGAAVWFSLFMLGRDAKKDEDMQ